MRRPSGVPGGAALPGEIVSNVPGSFAWSVLHDRHPAIIRQLGETLPYPPSIRDALDSLCDELEGTIHPLRVDAHDTDCWGTEFLGRSWYDVPFLWAESYYYRKLLDAVGYFRPGPWRSIDPFEPQKSAELRDPGLAAHLAAMQSLAALGLGEQTTAALDAALWGNQADLGFLLSDPAARHRDRAGALVADDGEALRGLLLDGGLETVCLVADNAGRELISDLVLIDLLLRSGRVRSVDLHLKPWPYYVSDATTADLLACLRRLAEIEATRVISDRLHGALAGGRLRLTAHPFYCRPLSYHDLPAELSEVFAGAGLAILKGDLNYRRLVGDRDWPPTTPFQDLVGYFPTRVASLRVLKSDVAVGIAGDVVAALDATGSPWRTNGSHALIQLR